MFGERTLLLFVDSLNRLVSNTKLSYDCRGISPSSYLAGKQQNIRMAINKPRQVVLIYTFTCIMLKLPKTNTIRLYLQMNWQYSSEICKSLEQFANIREYWYIRVYGFIYFICLNSTHMIIKWN